MARSRLFVEPSLVALVLFFIFLKTSGSGSMVGGRREVKDVKTNKDVQNLGKFCVKEFNKQVSDHQGNGSGDELMFLEVVEAQSQVVSGIKYYLRIQATTMSGERKMFDSVVVVKPWLESKELLNFESSVKTNFRLENDIQ